MGLNLFARSAKGESARGCEPKLAPNRAFVLHSRIFAVALKEA